MMRLYGTEMYGRYVGYHLYGVYIGRLHIHQVQVALLIPQAQQGVPGDCGSCV